MKAFPEPDAVRSFMPPEPQSDAAAGFRVHGRRDAGQVEEVPDRPSIKGSVFRYHIEEILKRVSTGEISRDELVRRLGPGDVAVLDTPILATQWYDVRTYERIVLLRQELEGDDSEDCLGRYGAEAAERLMAAGLYKQINRYLATGCRLVAKAIAKLVLRRSAEISAVSCS